MKKICFIIPYFGSFPNYFSLWIESCAKNDTVDFLLISDNSKPNNLPSNFTYLSMSFSEMQTIIHNLYGEDFYINKPYKLCDYKPLYGEIFNEYLREYDFWGYCDMDLIFGDIRSFITDDILDNHEKIFSLGHCTLFKNINEMNSFYKKTDYNSVFHTNYICHFDEWGGVSLAAAEQNIRQYDEKYMADIDTSRYRFQSVFETEVGPQIYRYCNGHLHCIYLQEERIKEREYMYIHLQKRQMKVEIDVNKNSYFIVPNAFVEINEDEIGKVLEAQKIDKIYFEWYKTRTKQIIGNVLDGALKMRVKNWKQNKKI